MLKTCPFTTTSCALTTIAVPTLASLPSGRRYNAPYVPRAAKSVSGMRPYPGMISYRSSSLASYDLHDSFRLRSIRASPRQLSRTNPVSSFPWMSFEKSVNHRGSNRFKRTLDPGTHAIGYGMTGMENSPGSRSDGIGGSRYRGFPSSSSSVSASASAPFGSAPSIHVVSGRDEISTTAGSFSAEFVSSARPGAGKIGMSRKIIWSCWRRSASAASLLNALARTARSAFARSAAAWTSARARSASSSLLISSSSSLFPSSAFRALIVSTDDDGDVDSSDDLASEGDSDGSEDASFFPKNDGSFHARHRTDDRAARPGYDAIRAGVDAARWARAPRARDALGRSAVPRVGAVVVIVRAEISGRDPGVRSTRRRGELRGYARADASARRRPMRARPPETEPDAATTIRSCPRPRRRVWL
eukprot:8694-Pelagococcus_subviridis.AAC.11